KQHRDPSLHEHYRRSWATYYPRYVTHAISIRIVWLLQDVRITPNQITLLSFGVGFLSACFFLSEEKWSILLAAFLFELFYILDAVDGQLARVKNVHSLGGAFLDEWGNFIIAPLIIYCIGFRTNMSGVQFLAAFSIISVPVIEVLKDRFIRKSKEGLMSTQATSNHLNIFKFIYSLLYRSCTMPVVMNLTTLSAILDILTSSSPSGFFLPGLIIYYAIIGSCVWIIQGLYVGLRNYVP
ncbi:MAG: CDP-alcohol phosphatidyltransferase family protein, partial [Deltaproteobacteria bacterium]